ncbi:MAG: hypothetical protein QE284_01810 [Rhizobium sp.]|nr:hypothetical protein [Rhizobium sp.]
MLDQLAAIARIFNVIPHVGALIVAYLLALPIGWDRKKANAVRVCGHNALMLIKTNGKITVANGPYRRCYTRYL